MKHLLWGAFAATAIACGGGTKTTAAPQPEPEPEAKSACAVAAENVAGLVIGAKVDDMTEEQRPGIVRVLTERCQADAWSDEVIACLTKVSDTEEEIARCGDMLTEAQEDAVEDQLEREVMPKEMKTDEAMPPPAPPARSAPPKPDDPCGGGA